METAVCGVLRVPGMPGRHTGSWQCGIQRSASPINHAALSKAQAFCGASVSAREKAERVISPPPSLPEMSRE